MSKVNTKNKIIENCILSLANGNIDQMDLLYETIKNDLYAFALSKVYNTFDADDILQDTFIRIYENAKLYTPKGKPMAWIITIEVNVIKRFFQIKNKKEILADDLVIDKAKDNSSNLEDTVFKNKYLNQLFNHLNELERNVILLHVLSNLKFREIAILLDKPLSTVLSKYNRAIKKLKEIAKEENIYE